jgi:biotin synthase
MIEREAVAKIYHQPIPHLLYQAHEIHRRHHKPEDVQLSQLLSIKTGGCPENCSYCPQSAHYETGVKKEKLMSRLEVVEEARKAKENGATRFCMGAAWREVKDGPDFDQVIEMVKDVRKLEMQVCCTLGMLNEAQAERLKEAGLYAYNHNIDSSREYYSKIISTRTYDDRLQTIANVRKAGLTVCTGGIIGMGETEDDRIDFLLQLATFDPPPESITINALIPIAGTPLEESKSATAMELARVIATARVLIPESMIRLSAGRKGLTPEGHFLCFYAGANSIFLGDKLLTSSNPSLDCDRDFFKKSGYQPMLEVRT